LISEAKDKLQTEISVMRDIMADPEKSQGRLSREDKVRCLRMSSCRVINILFCLLLNYLILHTLHYLVLIAKKIQHMYTF